MSDIKATTIWQVGSWSYEDMLLTDFIERLTALAQEYPEPVRHLAYVRLDMDQDNTDANEATLFVSRYETDAETAERQKAERQQQDERERLFLAQRESQERQLYAALHAKYGAAQP